MNLESVSSLRMSHYPDNHTSAVLEDASNSFGLVGKAMPEISQKSSYDLDLHVRCTFFFFFLKLVVLAKETRTLS